jgi:Flp pilus assembly protein TadG
MRRGFFFPTDDRGNSAVEFALTAPAFLALLFGAFQGGLMLWTQLGLQHAVERAARCAAVNATLCGTSDLVKAYAVTQGLASSVASGSYTLTTETCGKAVTATQSVRFVTATVSLTAKSCFPK